MIRYGPEARLASKLCLCTAGAGSPERAGFARAGVEEPSPAIRCLLMLLPVAIHVAEVILARAPKARKRAFFARLAHPEGERMRAGKGG